MADRNAAAHERCSYCTGSRRAEITFDSASKTAQLQSIGLGQLRSEVEWLRERLTNESHGSTRAKEVSQLSLTVVCSSALCRPRINSTCRLKSCL